MYKNKNVLVCGIGRSGITSAELINGMGGNVVLQDMKQRAEIPVDFNILKIEDKGIELYLGQNPDDIITNQDLIVLSPGIPMHLQFIKTAYENNIPVIGEIELAFRHTPCPVIAITGTNGKTTTTTIVGEIMKEFYEHAEVVGNIGISYTGAVSTLTSKSWVVAEISSFQMETAVDFHSHISAVLNITPDHLNRHKTMENYISMKERVFKHQNENDFTILNFDDEDCVEMAKKTNGNVLFFSSKHILEQGIYIENNEIKMNFQNKSKNIDINETIIATNELQILGIHNYENVMASIAICAMAFVDFDCIKKVLRKFKGVPHRIEYVDTINDVNYYNDSKATNVEAGICGVLAMNRPIILIGGGYDKGDDFTDWIKSFGDKVKHLILIGDTAKKINDCAINNGFTNVSICDNMYKAVILANDMAKKGDCVLLSPACASFDMFADFEKRGDYFKECIFKLPR